jgi:hypothetical protein
VRRRRRRGTEEEEEEEGEEEKWKVPDARLRVPDTSYLFISVLSINSSSSLCYTGNGLDGSKRRGAPVSEGT